MTPPDPCIHCGGSGRLLVEQVISTESPVPEPPYWVECHACRPGEKRSSEAAMDRETKVCPVCAAGVGEPCIFPAGEPWMIVEDGVRRRVVHAGRYAETLTEAEAATFWGTAVEKYLGKQLAARFDPPDDLDDDPRLWTTP